MNLENTITAPESPAGNWQEKGLVYDDGSTTARSPQQILQSALTALREGNVSEVLELFADHFTFNDHLLTLQFTDKRHLREFFEKSRELFPDTALEIVSLFGEACGYADCALRCQQLPIPGFPVWRNDRARREGKNRPMDGLPRPRFIAPDESGSVLYKGDLTLPSAVRFRNCETAEHSPVSRNFLAL
jgi:hypothetical protein